MKDTDKAFPSLMTFETVDGVQRLESGGPGMSLKEYAAIQLRVPRSGDKELDDWIKESRRAEFAQAAFAGVIAEANQYFIDQQAAKNIAGQAVAIADAMLAEWEAGK
jgi:hypothetical protein